MPELQTLMSAIAFGESPRWHEDRLWFSEWGTQEIIAVDLEGKSELIVSITSFPLCIDFLPDGRLLIVSARDRLLLCRESDGSLVTHTDLSSLSNHPWNDIVVDGRGNAYIGNIGFEFPWGVRPRKLGQRGAYPSGRRSEQEVRRKLCFSCVIIR